MQTALSLIMRDYLIRFQQTAIKETGRRPLTYLREPKGQAVSRKHCGIRVHVPVFGDSFSSARGAYE